MAYYNDTDAAKLLDLEIDARQKILSLYGEVIRTVQSFDGKVLNKRLETALKKIDRNITLNTEYGMCAIRYYTRDFTAKQSNSEYGTLYLADNYITMCHCGGNSATDYDRRILATPIVDSLYRYMEMIENSVDEIQQKRELVGEYKNRLSNIEQQLKELQDEIPATMKQYYGLYRYLRSS